MDINRNILTEVFELDFLNENYQRPSIKCVIDNATRSIVGYEIVNSFDAAK